MGEDKTSDVGSDLPSYKSLYKNQQGQQSVDIELDNNNDEKTSKDQEVVIARKQTLGEKIVAKSEMLKNLEGDKLHVCILLFLYCLQGIPLGLKSSIPLILTRRSVPYTEQARFTIASYPFSMKVGNSHQKLYFF